MTRRLVGWLPVAAFAIAVGHLAWHALVGPPVPPKYYISGDVVLTGTDPDERQLHLRRELYLAQQPRQAWLEVLSRDNLRVYVNGHLLGNIRHNGFDVGAVVDLAPFLQIGRNVIAIHAAQGRLDKPPVVAVRGAYRLSDGEHPLGTDGIWRCCHTFERRAYWWFETPFDDRHWPNASRSTASLRAKVPAPPRAVSVPPLGHWITPPWLDQTRAAVRRTFDVPGRPRQAWLRLVATSSYRLAVNGILLDEQEDQVGTRLPIFPVQRTYDITNVVHSGRNVVALALANTMGPPHLLADLEVEDASGQLIQVSSDDRWLAQVGLPAGWGRKALDVAAWHTCTVEPGDLDVPPWRPRRETIALVLSPPVWAWRLAGQLAVIVVVALLTALACWLVPYLLPGLRQAPDRPAAAHIVYLALVPATLAIAAGVLATFDPRIATQDVYQGRWVLLAIASVGLQWLFLAWLPRSEQTAAQTASPPPARRPAWAAGCVVAVLVVVGFWLRYQKIPTEPLNPDEVTVLRVADGLLEHGFPSLQIHKDLPTLYSFGTELENVGPALVRLVSNDDRLASRLPPVLWSTLTIVLIYVVGRRLFDTPTGLIAAGIYTFSSACIGMAYFGRYQAQLQFLTLLTVYFFLRIIAGTGPIDRRALALTALSFLLLFLSWEAGAFIAIGMILVALWQRRGRLRSILCDGWLWLAMVLLITVVVVQYAHLVTQQTHYMLYGTGWGDITLTPMWRFTSFFSPLRYVWDASWSDDAFLPALAFAGTALLLARHRFRQSALALLVIFLSTAILMSSLMPVIAWRYSYHLIPFVILLGAAAVSAAAQGLVRLARQAGAPSAWGWYARAVAGVGAVVFVVLASGLTLRLDELALFRVEGFIPGVFRFATLDGPARYVCKHIRPGDVVIADHPDVNNHHVLCAGGCPLGPGWVTDFCLESKLEYVAVLDDRRTLPLHRWCGTDNVMSLEGIEDLFARHRRIWYVIQPDRHTAQNLPEVSEYIRQNMDIVYEDFNALVLFRDNNHRTADRRLRDDTALKKAGANYIP
jgi:4-amino-4-deoxy-L-arabinose transferase-like glycosyltransferase